MRRAIGWILLLTLAAGGASAAELAGVTMPAKITVGESELELNGLGLRKKAFIKVYVAGLYLAERQSDPAAILAADTPRRIVLDFRFGVDAEKMCEAWNDGLAANTPNAGADLESSFAELCGMMADMEKGDTMTFTYEPAAGTAVDIRGERRGTIGGKPFADALFACWLGPEPPGQDLKEGLLGG